MRTSRPSIRNGEKIIIAGPCSVESESQIMYIAKELALSNRVHILRGGVWKPRTRPGCFEGYGEKALMWLRSAGDEYGLPAAIEVATTEHVDLALKHGIDILWIGARTTVNPFQMICLADALAGVNAMVMVKNPVSPDLELWIGAIERLKLCGVNEVIAIHRGFTPITPQYYKNDPIWRIPIELKTRLGGLPVVCDPSHLSGSRTLIYEASQNAMDLSFDGLMVEVHNRPEDALSDSGQQITPEEFIELLGRLKVREAKIQGSFIQNEIEENRAKIAKIDNTIINLISKRMVLSREIGEYNTMKYSSLYQSERYKQLLASRIQKGIDFDLNPELICKLWDFLNEGSVQI